MGLYLFNMSSVQNIKKWAWTNWLTSLTGKGTTVEMETQQFSYRETTGKWKYVCIMQSVMLYVYTPEFPKAQGALQEKPAVTSATATS